MQAFEVIAMVSALGLMFAAVGARILFSQLLAHMKFQINQVAQIKQEALGRLKTVQSHKSVGEQNKATLLTKKAKLAKKVSRLRSEMGEMKDADEARRQRTEMRRIE